MVEYVFIDKTLTRYPSIFLFSNKEKKNLNNDIDRLFIQSYQPAY